MPEALLTPAQYLDRLAGSASRFADLVEAADLEAPVAACPGWTVRDLAWHLGGVHRWAAFALRENRAGEESHDGPAQAGPLGQWLREGSGVLLDALRDSDPAAPCWNFGPPPRLAGFWFRRQALETAMHLWDAQAAAASGSGSVAGSPDPELAADGVAEVVELMFPRQVRLGRCPALGTSLALQATEPGGRRWVLAADGLPGPATAPDAPAAATVSGTSGALWLLLWKRIPVPSPGLLQLDGDLALDGDPAAAAAVLGAPIVP